MLRSSTPRFGIALWTLLSCGSPAELDEQRFPRPDDTGYTDGPFARGGSGSVAAAQGGSTSQGAGGSTSQGQGGGPEPTAGNGNASLGGGTSDVGGAPNGSGENGGSGSEPAGGNGSTDGCPDDITLLFARPSAEGGCTNTGGCHEAGSPIKPDLVSPGVEARLLDVASACSFTSDGQAVGPRPYIGATDSFLQEKIAGSPYSSCGYSMPFLEPQTLSAADEQCIIDWIAEVAGGGG